MIFKQISEIVAGTKTQTRRVIKPGEKYFGLSVYTAGGRIKWRVGQDYAVVPKRGYHGVFYDIETHVIYGHGYEPVTIRAQRWPCIVPLRYEILSIHSEPLQSISRADAKREGVNDVGEYRKLWESINNRPGIRWTDNQFVWVIDFEVLKPGGNK